MYLIPKYVSIAQGSLKWYNHFGKVWQYFTKLSVYLCCYTVVLFLDIYPREMKVYIPKKTNVGMVIAVSFAVAQTGHDANVPQCTTALLGCVKE